MHCVRVRGLMGHGVRVGVGWPYAFGMTCTLADAEFAVEPFAAGWDFSAGLLAGATPPAACSNRVSTVLLSVLRRLLVTFVTRVASRHGDRRRHHVVTVRVRHHATKVRRVGGLLLDGGAAVDRVGQLGHHTGVARLLLTRFRLRLLRLLLLLTLLLRLLTLLLSLLHAPTSRTGGGIKTKAEVAAAEEKFPN